MKVTDQIYNAAIKNIIKLCDDSLNDNKGCLEIAVTDDNISFRLYSLEETIDEKFPFDNVSESLYINLVYEVLTTFLGDNSDNIINCHEYGYYNPHMPKNVLIVILNEKIRKIINELIFKKESPLEILVKNKKRRGLK